MQMATPESHPDRAASIAVATVVKEMGTAASHSHLPLTALELGILKEAPSAFAGPGREKKREKGLGYLIACRLPQPRHFAEN